MTLLKYKKLSIPLLALIFVIGITVPFSARAWMMGADAAVVWIIQMLTKLWFFTWVTNYLLRMANGVLGWVTDPNFITDAGGYTQNTLVQEGWHITRDLVNMFFILIMVGIGIATILRVKGYEIKKLLPKAIIIILLINFTPIICGLIIDASNILTNFFLSAGSRGMGEMINRIEAPQSSIGGQIWSFVKGAATGNYEKMAFAIFHSLVTLTFNIIASFVLLALSVLFLMRYIMLWILVILSPLAFFCYILPNTKKIWTMWWNQFIQWCFIGIGAAFFLYLTQRIVDIIGDGKFITSPSAGETQMGDTGLAIVFLYLIPLVFLAAGYMATTMFAPTGAKQILGLAKWPMSKKGKATREKFKNWRQGKAREVAGPKVQKAINKLASYKPDWGQDNSSGTGVGRWAKRGAASVVGLATKTATEPTKMVFGKGSAASGRVTSEAYKKAKDQDMWANTTDLKTASKEQKLGIMRAMSERKQIKEAMKQNSIHTNDLTDVFKEATLTGDKKTTKELSIAMVHKEDVMQNFGKIAEKITGDKNGLSEKDKAKGYKSYQDKTLAGLRKEDDFEKLQMTDDLEEKMGDIAVNFYDAQQLGQAGRTLGRSFIDSVQNNAQEKGASWFFEINEDTGKARNPNVPRYFASTGAANMGHTPLSGANTIKEMEGFQVESRHWEAGIRAAKTPEEINNLVGEMDKHEEESANEEIKKIITSAKLAAQKKLQETTGTVKTKLGEIHVTEEATEDIRRQREERAPGGEGETERGRKAGKSRAPGGERD